VAGFVSEMEIKEHGDVFVHLDPYNPAQNSVGGKTAVQLFSELVNKGIKTMLWFGLETLRQRETAKGIFRKMQSETHSPICIAEILLNIISESTAPINPGVLGCGIMTGNLGDASVECMKTYGRLIEKAYETATIDGRYDGSLKFLFNDLIE
jgi:23S rRNA (adenine2030-N6)-methyltransferase